MRRVVVLATLLLVAWLARDAGVHKLLNPLPARSPHESYIETLTDSGIADTPLGREWIAASTRALASPTRVSIPHERTSTFVAERPETYALRVTLNRGQRVEVTAEAEARTPAQVFVDIFTADTDDDLSHEAGAIRGAQYEADADRDVIVRVQPELLRGGRLQMTLRARPALRFPVRGAGARDLHSGFGDPRDAGRRRPEGVDIFAGRGTPVLAATDGIVTRVGEGGLGGRVVWVWNPARGLMLYYAHLDEQLVSTGERVQAGEVLGTVGNTGNARGTPPHLHFGIYERGSGAIDPYWFIAPARPAANSRR